MKQTVQSKLILEMAATSEMLGIASEIKPDVVTLVPEKREELTTEGGLDASAHQSVLQEAVSSLKNSGIQVSIFVDPDLDQIKACQKVGSDMIEVHTGAFCEATSRLKKEREFARIVDSIKFASKLKLGVNAGHGICYNSIKAFKGLSQIDEFSIGHSIVSRAVITGMEQAVRDMARLIREL